MVEQTKHKSLTHFQSCTTITRPKVLLITGRGKAHKWNYYMHIAQICIEEAQTITTLLQFQLKLGKVTL